MRTTSILLLAGLLVACSVPPVKQAPTLEPIALRAGEFSNVLDLSVFAVKLPYDEGKMRMQYGWLCEFGREVALPNDRLPITRRDLYEGFRRALAPLNYRLPKPSESVFQPLPSERAELLLGATVVKREASLCFPFSGSPTLAFGNTSKAKGSVYLQVIWEVFSASEQKVVFKKTTEGTYRTDVAIDGAETAMTMSAFTASLLSLTADSDFQDLVRRKPNPPTNNEVDPRLPA